MEIGMGEKFDAVVVGGGIAGCVAATVMARAGLEVILVERGNFSGSKNVTGGRLYSHSLEKIFPGFAKEAPIERRVTRERLSFTTPENAVTLEYSCSGPGNAEKDSYVVCRSRFDRWLAEKAEEAGVMMICGIRVDDLIMKDSKVCGIIAGEDEIEADVVVLADGVNSLLGQKCGLKSELTPKQVALGTKEVIELGEKVIEERFGLAKDEGLSWIFSGSVSGGAAGGGFLYTNSDSISLGVTVNLNDIDSLDKTIPQLLEEFKHHPVIEPIIRGGKLVEYSGHLIPEGGINAVSTLYGDGVLAVGDAAGLVINLGYQVRGMDLAVASGELAAKAIIEAKNNGDFSKSSLKRYEELLKESFVMKDLESYKGAPEFLENSRLYQEAPQQLDHMMADLFTVDGQNARHLAEKLMDTGGWLRTELIKGAELL
ncbi:FAD-dependent oxidoreductase [Desulfosporosinus fructosivorans]|nr:FAD-dependent oxidoreductase [Desulfosporosinus fructosivorans]